MVRIDVALDTVAKADCFLLQDIDGWGLSTIDFIGFVHELIMDDCIIFDCNGCKIGDFLDV